MFCQIVSLPRSGSHMLGTALHSHPELSCKGEISGNVYDHYAEDGNVEIVHVIGHKPDAEKYIVLVRSYIDRDLSWQRTTSHHFTEQIELPKGCENPNRKLVNAEENQQLLYDFINNNDCLVLNYEELTANEDMREIPETYGRQICKYLGVVYQPLTPITYKPNVV